MTTHTTSTASNGHGSAAREKTMLAGRLHFDPRRFAVEEVPVPAPGPGEVLVAVKAAGVCLSDVHLIDGSLSSPFNRNPAVTLGHEVAGAIEAIGPDVTGWEIGQRVVLQAGQSCEAFHRFRPGTLLRAATSRGEHPRLVALNAQRGITWSSTAVGHQGLS